MRDRRTCGCAGLVAVALACLTTVGCGTYLPDAPGRLVRAAKPGPVARATNAFAVDLYAKLADRDGNLFFSPYSISTALAMTYAGARGETERQMAEVLHFAMGQEELHPALSGFVDDLNARAEKAGVEFSVANALWGQKGYAFRDEFLDLVRANYGAGLREVDFAGATEAARHAINDWTERETRGRIADLIGPGILDELTRLVLTNAIYFKGAWAVPFRKRATRDAPFTLLGGEKAQVRMMHGTASFLYGEARGLQMLELAYVGGERSMVVLLPRKLDGLPGLEESLTREKLAKWLGIPRRRKVRVFLPRFKTACRFRLDETLKSMGMTDAFVYRVADFSGMTDKEALFVQAVLHKAFADVNEEGTEAAAATAVAVAPYKLTKPPPPPPVFRADHPFLFLIRDRRTGAILFMGRVTNPKE
jgi:serpin B